MADEEFTELGCRQSPTQKWLYRARTLRGTKPQYSCGWMAQMIWRRYASSWAEGGAILNACE
mgnify:CR=1 FL=1